MYEPTYIMGNVATMNQSAQESMHGSVVPNDRSRRRRLSASALQLSPATRESRAFPTTRTAPRTQKSIVPQSLHRRSSLHRLRERKRASGFSSFNGMELHRRAHQPYRRRLSCPSQVINDGFFQSSLPCKTFDVFKSRHTSHTGLSCRPVRTREACRTQALRIRRRHQGAPHNPLSLAVHSVKFAAASSAVLLSPASARIGHSRTSSDTPSRNASLDIPHSGVPKQQPGALTRARPLAQ